MGNDTSKETAKSVMPKPPKILIKNNFVGIKGIYHCICFFFLVFFQAHSKSLDPWTETVWQEHLVFIAAKERART